MSNTVFLRWAGLAVAASLSTAALAGGAGPTAHPVVRPMMVRPALPATHPVRFVGHPGPLRAGGGRTIVRTRAPMVGSIGAPRSGFVLQAGVSGPFHGHTATGSLHRRTASRFAWARQRGFGYAGAPGLYGADVGPDRTIYGGYGGEIQPVYEMGAGAPEDYGTTRTGSDGTEGAGFAEPPLNTVGSGARIMTLNPRRPRLAEGCACEAGAPMVYRFGVGSYY